jgi:hypothetical protein
MTHRAARILFLLGLIGLCATACVQAPPVNESRSVLWQQFGGQSLDKLLLAWGTPAGETKLTNGSRMVTYRHATTYDASPSTGCEVSFLAPPPRYKINDIAMVGDPFECRLLAQGIRGDRHINNLPPPGFYPYPYPYR